MVPLLGPRERDKLHDVEPVLLQKDDQFSPLRLGELARASRVFRLDVCIDGVLAGKREWTLPKRLETALVAFAVLVELHRPADVDTEIGDLYPDRQRLRVAKRLHQVRIGVLVCLCSRLNGLERLLVDPEAHDVAVHRLHRGGNLGKRELRLVYLVARADPFAVLGEHDVCRLVGIALVEHVALDDDNAVRLGRALVPLEEFLLGDGNRIEDRELEIVKRIFRILRERLAVKEHDIGHRGLVAHRAEELERRRVRDHGGHAGGGERIAHEDPELRDGRPLDGDVGDLKRPYALPGGESGERYCGDCGCYELFHGQGSFTWSCWTTNRRWRTPRKRRACRASRRGRSKTLCG